MAESEIHGHFIDGLPREVEYLMIGFSPSSIPLKQRWRTNGLSADFIADYLQTFFVGPREDRANGDVPIPVDSKNAVKYIANELLENAMKFHDDTHHYQTKIMFHLCRDKLVFQVVNTIDQTGKDKFVKFIQALEHDDPYELYIRQMEANAQNDGSSHSGLGFLSMICDYSANLGWKFELIAKEPPVYAVTTMVSLDV